MDQPKPTEPHDFAQWTAHLPAQIHALNLSTHEGREDAIQLIHQLDEYSAYASLQAWKVAAEMLRKLFNISPSRFETILKLPRREHQRDALLYATPDLPPRFDHERVYPIDGWIGDYLCTVEGMEVPLAWHFWAAVSALGTAARRNFGLSRGAYYLWPNHYIMIVGPTGERKTTAMLQAGKMMSMANHHIESGWNTSGQALIEDRRLTVAYSSGSPEGFLDQLEVREAGGIDARGLPQPYYRTDSCALLFHDECVNLIGQSNVNAARWVERITMFYGCPETFEDVLRNKIRRFKDMSINVLFGSTIEWLGKCCTPEMFEGGAMGRFMYIERDTSGRIFPTPPIVDPVRTFTLSKHLVALSHAKRGTPTRMAEDALALFNEWYVYNKSMQIENIYMRGYHNRKHDHLLKLALILALSKDVERPTITKSLLNKALDILSREEETMSSTFKRLITMSRGGSRGGSIAVEHIMYEALYASGGGLEQAAWMRIANVTVREFNEGKVGLIAKKRVRCAPRRTEGNPTPALEYFITDPMDKP